MNEYTQQTAILRSDIDNNGGEMLLSCVGINTIAISMMSFDSKMNGFEIYKHIVKTNKYPVPMLIINSSDFRDEKNKYVLDTNQLNINDAPFIDSTNPESTSVPVQFVVDVRNMEFLLIKCYTPIEGYVEVVVIPVN